MDGMTYLVGQIALPLVVALLAGVVIGHLVWPGRRAAQADDDRPDQQAPQPAQNVTPAARTRTQRPQTGPDTNPIPLPAADRSDQSNPLFTATQKPDPGPDRALLAAHQEIASLRGELNRLLGEKDAERHDAAALRAELTRLSDEKARLSDEMTRLAGENDRLSDEKDRLAGENDRLSDEKARLGDEKDTEIGRLESGAVQAMETTMANSRERVSGLETQLREAAEQRRRLEVRLESEQRRVAQLESQLVERDRRLIQLSSPPGPKA